MNLAIFASGSGSNFQAIVDAVESNRLRARVVLCLSNREHAGVLARADSHGIARAVISPDAFPDASEYRRALEAILESHNVDFIALAGYLKMIPAWLIANFRNRIVNIHPALLPRFGGKGLYGLRVHRAVLEAGVAESGATVHLVDESYDTGPIVAQRSVPVRPEDTPETLAARILEVEHLLYPETLSLFADGRIEVSDNRVIIH